jgi:hypothetical protein
MRSCGTDCVLQMKDWFGTAICCPYGRKRVTRTYPELSLLDRMATRPGARWFCEEALGRPPIATAILTRRPDTPSQRIDTGQYR